MDKQLEGQISLEDYLATKDEIVVDPDSEITLLEGDDTTASSLLRRLASLEKQIKANSDMAERERAKITMWETGVNEPLQRSALWLRSALEQYALHERAEFERKTINLPFGVLKTTVAQPKWVVRDADAFIAWAEANNHTSLYRVKKEAALTAIKGTLDVNSNNEPTDEIGIPVPGLAIETPPQPFNVTVKPSL